ncbi:hypothetical protein [Larkinella soli]|uniref:hypothetical protein n=1 Tax=Larkinella soli TaxID=1770527 RepID=UPI000FFC178E|nr:hypothetical protein [Larkinella soli]
MGKRLIRIRTTQLPELVAGFTGSEVNLVLVDGRTLHGRLTRVQDDELHLVDSIGHRHTVSFEAVDELITDEKSSF